MTGPIANIRNLAFVGHPSSGKTTLVDALAHLTGASPRKGSVADKSSICDTEPEEHEKQHTLQSAAVFAQHGGKTWTFLDTPGYPEFIAETAGAMFGADVVVGVVSCSSGVTFNLRTKMTEASALPRGRIIVVTHVDGENADFDALVEELRSGIGEVCVPVLVPDKSGQGFSAVRSILGDPENEWRENLMDRVMDACEDEELMMEYLETQELSDDALHRELPNAIQKGSLVPILACNPESGLGVSEVLDFFGEFGPSPELCKGVDVDGGVVEPDPSGSLVATVFNVKADPHVGKVCLFRVYRGTLEASSSVVAVGSDDREEKLGGLFRMVGKKRENADKVGPGDIAAFSKVEKVPNRATFTTAGADAVRIAVRELPGPTVSIAVTPRSRADEQKIGEALVKLSSEDPTFIVEHRPETHQMVVSGMSDLHLQVMEARLKRRFGVEIETAIPRIAYKETITKPAEGHHRHKKQSGGRGQFGECYLRVKPVNPGDGIVFTDAIVGGSIPRNLIPAVEKGIREIAKGGILTQSQVVDVEVELYDGKFHAVDSDEASFKMAGARAFRDAFEKAAPVLLEPVMEVEIHVPTDDAGSIFSDITSQRRGQVIDQWNEADGAITAIKAHVPLVSMQTYFRDLKSMTAGEGSYSMKMSSYERVPGAEQQKVLAEHAKKHEDD